MKDKGEGSGGGGEHLSSWTPAVVSRGVGSGLGSGAGWLAAGSCQLTAVPEGQWVSAPP